MRENRLPDYLDHMHQAALDVLSFVNGMDKSSRQSSMLCDSDREASQDG
jgi:hypothetical protein